MNVVLTDVLVLGCGPAGLLASLEARRAGCRVLACDKGIIGNDCSAVGAKQMAGIGPWSVEGDSVDLYFEDVLESGCRINDEKLVRRMVEAAGPLVVELHKIGMPFDRDGPGKQIAVAGPAPGHSKARSLHFSDITGKMLVETLAAECLRRGVELRSEQAALDLLVQEGRATGALLLDRVSGELQCVRAKAVLLATGGLGQLYELTSNPALNSGDGIALALRAGAELMDMEFVQFYPVTVLHPPVIRGMNLNSQHNGGQLINSEGERFMSRYYPKEMERVTRDKLSQSIFQEILAGRVGPHGGVFMDATMIPAEEYQRKIPSEWRLAQHAGIDLSRDRLEIAPSAHYFMGGIRIDDRCASSLPGLFAAGECTAGVQGANRLANNGLTEAVVFGAIGGKSAGQYAAGEPELPPLDLETVEELTGRIEALFSPDGVPGDRMSSEVRAVMTRNVGIVRTEESLRQAEERLRESSGRTLSGRIGGRWNPGLMAALSVRNMILLGRAIAGAARLRRESRGAHYRQDFPDRDEAGWLANVVVTRTAGGQLRFHKRMKQEEQRP